MFKASSGATVNMHQVVTPMIGPNNDLVYKICDLPDDEDLIWKVAYEIPQSGSPPWVVYFANGVIPKEDIQDCKGTTPQTKPACADIKGCYGIEWRDSTVTITLPDFPNCPITYKFQYRDCGQLPQWEHQIRGVRIAFMLDPGCWNLFNWLCEGAPEGAFYNPDRVASVFMMSYMRLADLYFENFVSQSPYPFIFDCNNPMYLRQGGIVTYTRGQCISYCGSYFRNINGDLEAIFGEDPCVDTVCCRTERKYCLDFSFNPPKTVVEETKELTNMLQCDPWAIPVRCSCPNGPGIILHYRSPCMPTCE